LNLRLGGDRTSDYLRCTLRQAIPGQEIGVLLLYDWKRWDLMPLKAMAAFTGHSFDVRLVTFNWSSTECPVLLKDAHLLLEEPPSPNNNRILEPLRVNRIFRRSRLAEELGLWTDAGLSDIAESVGEGSTLLASLFVLLGIQRPKTLRRLRTLFP
jgi:hypothetical protein